MTEMQKSLSETSMAKVNNFELPPPPPQPLPLSSRVRRKHQPQTSSPAAGEATAPLAFTDQDMTVSPLAAIGCREDQGRNYEKIKAFCTSW